MWTPEFMAHDKWKKEIDKNCWLLAPHGQFIVVGNRQLPVIIADTLIYEDTYRENSLILP